MKRPVLALAAAACLCWASAALGTDAPAPTGEAAIERSFYPYKEGVPTREGLTPGTIINKANWEKYKDVLDEGLQRFLAAGWLEIKVGPTTPIELNKNYIALTRANYGKASLGEAPGHIVNYHGGRPFPDAPDPADPRAGEKLAWNYLYGINHADNDQIYPFHWKYRDLTTGKIERRLETRFNFLNYMYRYSDPKVPEILPNPAKYFRGIYGVIYEPLDLKDTQFLFHRFDDDSKRDEGYLDLGFQRRVRRLAAGQMTDSFLGSDLMIEDIEGYNGRIRDMKWTYKGTKDMLVSYFNHDEQELSQEYPEKDGFRFIDFAGQGGCFPKVTYQLRKVNILEAIPTDPNHPASRRVYLQDAETGSLPRFLLYDKKGELWKWDSYSRSHPDHHHPKNRGAGNAVTDALTIIDVQAKHCTTFQFKTIVDPALSPASLFTVQHMRGER